MKLAEIRIDVGEIDGWGHYWSHKRVEDFRAQDPEDSYWGQVTDADIEIHNQKVHDDEKRGAKRLYVRVTDLRGQRLKAWISASYYGTPNSAEDPVNAGVLTAHSAQLAADSVAGFVKQAVSELLAEARSCQENHSAASPEPKAAPSTQPAAPA
jgi:hypothetical protein